MKFSSGIKTRLKAALLACCLCMLTFGKAWPQQIMDEGNGNKYFRVDLMDHSFFARMVMVSEFQLLDMAKVVASDEKGILYIYPFENQFDHVSKNIESVFRYIEKCETELNKDEQGALLKALIANYGTWIENYARSGERTTVNDSCHTSMPFCTGTIYTFPAGIDTYSQYGPYYGCLTSQPNPAWYHMRIGTSGAITIKMTSDPSEDIDFCLWGPFDNPVSPCPMNATNGGLTSGKIVDCSYSSSATEYADITNGITGQYYILVITNYSDDPCNITFQQTGGSGTTDCTILPPPASSNSPVCVGQTIQLSAANVTNATYNWTGPAGFTSQLQNPVIYNAQTIHAGIYSLTITVNGQTSAPTTTEVIVQTMLPQANMPQGPSNLCINAPDSQYTTTLLPGADSYSWSLLPADAGIITGTGTNAVVNWNNLFFGQAQIGVSGVNSCGAGVSSPLLQVQITSTPLEMPLPTGPQSICQGSEPTQYSTTGSLYATSYEWMLQPTGAGTISGSGQSISVNWSAGFFGTAMLKVRGVNTCGNSAWSPTLDIFVSELPGTCAVPVGPVLFCNSGLSGNYSTTVVAGAVSYLWVIAPDAAGTVSGNSNAVSVNWSPSFSGTASIKVAAVNSCGAGTYSNTLSVSITDAPQVSAGNDTTVYSGAVIVLKGAITGNATGLQYHWEPAALLVNPNVLRPTTLPLSNTTLFTLTVTKTANNCQYEDNVLVEVSGAPLSAIVSGTPLQICPGGSSQLHVEAYGGNTGNYQYSWYQNSVLFSNLQSPVVSPSVTTTYTAQVFDGTSTFSGTVTIVVWPQVTANAGNDIQINFNTPATLSGSASPPGVYSYHWQPAPLLINPDIQNPVTVPLTESTVFTLTVEDQHQCMSPPDQVLVTVTGGQMVASASASPPAVCQGESSTLSVQVSGGNVAGYQFSWYHEGLLIGDHQSIVVEPENTGTYTAEIWDGFNTVSSDVILQVWTLPVASAGGDATIPNGTSVQLQGSASQGGGNYSYYWQPVEKVDNPAIANPTTVLMYSTTNFTLSVTDGNGCQDSDQVTVFVTGGLLFASIEASPAEICVGQTSDLTVLTSGGSGNYTYHWTSIPPGFSSQLKDVTVNPMVNTTYFLEVYDGFTTFSAQVPLIVNPLPLVNAGPDKTILNGTSTLLTSQVSGGSPPFNYLWSPSSFVMEPTNAQTLTTNLFSSQVFILQVTDSKGCSSYDQVEVLITGGPLQVNPVADEAVICRNQFTTLRAMPGGGSNNYVSYLWTGTDGYASTEASPQVSPETTTTYTVVVFDGFNSVSGNVTVTVNQLPEINLIPFNDPRVLVISPTEIGVCVHDTITLNAGNPGAIYLWSNGSTNHSISISTSGLSFDVQSFQVTVTNPETSCQNTANLTAYFTFQNCSYGIEEQIADNVLLVYPNPSHDGIFKVKIPDGSQPGQLKIFSLAGQQLLEMKFEKLSSPGTEMNLDLSHFAKGLYILKFEGLDRVWYCPVIISH